jgi:hypothetical protein
VHFSGRSSAWAWDVQGPGWGLRLSAALVLGCGAIASLRLGLGRIAGLLAALITIVIGERIVEHHKDFGLTFISLLPAPKRLELHATYGTWCAVGAAVLVLALALRPRPAVPAPGDRAEHP